MTKDEIEALKQMRELDAEFKTPEGRKRALESPLTPEQEAFLKKIGTGSPMPSRTSHH